MSHDERLTIARRAAESVGCALMRLPRTGGGEERGDQLKTVADLAAEGWVLPFLKTFFPGEPILAEESYGVDGRWPATDSYWTVDALDGTRSYAEGFAGFCVQIAYVEAGRPAVGVVYEPAHDRVYFATRGRGAFVSVAGSPPARLAVARWSARPRFVDSTRPRGRAGRWFAEHDADFVELGSIGLKICRVAEGVADVFLKELRFRTWDVAPGDLILSEAGGRLGCWDGSLVPYASAVVEHRDLLATASERFAGVVAAISGEQGA